MVKGGFNAVGGPWECCSYHCALGPAPMLRTDNFSHFRLCRSVFSERSLLVHYP